MNELTFTRRSFMQAAGVCTLSAACAAMTGCSGSSDTLEENEVQLGNFKIKITNMKTGSSDGWGSDFAEGTITPEIRFTYVGPEKISTKFKYAFSAEVDGTAFKLENGSSSISGSESLFSTGRKYYKPEFTTDDESTFKKYDNGQKPFVLKVTISNQTATFSIMKNGTVEVTKA